MSATTPPNIPTARTIKAKCLKCGARFEITANDAVDVYLAWDQRHEAVCGK